MRMSPTNWALFIDYVEKRCVGVAATRSPSTGKGTPGPPKLGRKRPHTQMEALVAMREATTGSAARKSEYSVTPNTFQFLQGLVEVEVTNLLTLLRDGAISLPLAKGRAKLLKQLAMVRRRVVLRAKEDNFEAVEQRFPGVFTDDWIAQGVSIHALRRQLEDLLRPGQLCEGL